MNDDPSPSMAPVHVVELSYASPTLGARPAYLTAVGVMSLIVGGLSALITVSSIARTIERLRLQSLGVYKTSALYRQQTFIKLGLAVLGLSAAGILIVAGVQLLRNRSSARRLHWLFVWIKIPLSAAALVHSLWMWSRVPSADEFVFIISCVVGSLSFVYPLVLVVVLMRTRTEEFFSA